MAVGQGSGLALPVYTMPAACCLPPVSTVMIVPMCDRQFWVCFVDMETGILGSLCRCGDRQFGFVLQDMERGILGSICRRGARQLGLFYRFGDRHSGFLLHVTPTGRLGLVLHMETDSFWVRLQGMGRPRDSCWPCSMGDTWQTM